MNKTTRTNLDDLHSEDRELQNKAFSYVLEATAKSVDWAYEVWDEMVETLRHKDNHQRAIAAQVLCNLAKSDPKKRMLKDIASRELLYPWSRLGHNEFTEPRAPASSSGL